MLMWDLIDLLNLVTLGQMLTSLNACFVTSYVQLVLVTRMENVKDVLMGTTYQEQLATNVMPDVQLAQDQMPINVQDVLRASSWMLQQTVHGLPSKTLLLYAGSIATKIKQGGTTS